MPSPNFDDIIADRGSRGGWPTAFCEKHGRVHFTEVCPHVAARIDTGGCPVRFS